jgi:hypothetical protein
MIDPKNAELPAFLQTFEDLLGHFDQHFEPLDNTSRGGAFAGLALKLVPFTSFGESFPNLRKREKKSHDDGVDLISDPSVQLRILCVQSKYKIPTKDDFDSVISKFGHFESTHPLGSTAGTLYADPDCTASTYVFAIVTASKLDGVLAQYAKSHLSSVSLYQQLLTSDRLWILDGPRILAILQRLYRQSHLRPNNIELVSDNPWVGSGAVRLGILKGTHLLDLYRDHGDALFFENIRDFMGLTSGKKVDDRDTVNQEIIKTIKEAPEKMIERNNGITFKAAKVFQLDDKTLRLEQGAIVNGCQTTMCIVHSRTLSNHCLVQAKVVETDDGWDIAKAANYQNPVTRIELDLARYLRPQLVQKAATDFGFALASKSESATGILDAIHQERVDYDELKYLYWGFFSRKPSNLFEGNYTELRADVLESLYADSAIEAEVFRSLFLILRGSRNAMEQASNAYQDKEYYGLIKRFFDESKPRYRAYVSVLALCGALRDNLAERSASAVKEAERMKKHLANASRLLEADAVTYQRCFLLAFQVLFEGALEASRAGSDKEVMQQMFGELSKSPFTTFYTKLLVRIDTLPALSH